MIQNYVAVIWLLLKTSSQLSVSSPKIEIADLIPARCKFKHRYYLWFNVERKTHALKIL